MKIRIPIDKITIKCSLEIYELMKRVLKREQKVDQAKEHFWVLAMNSANKILNLELVALGPNNTVATKPAAVLAIPLQKQAAGVILVHNHPSGNIEPSEADKDYTNLIIKACQLMKTPVLDHVIIAEHSYMSFKDSGLLEHLECNMKYALPYDLEKQFHKEMQEEIRKIRRESREKVKKSLEKGIQQGKKEGVEQGMQQEKLGIARSMLNDKEPIEKIQRWTGLDREEILSIERDPD